jgi:hypothetical protein
VTDAIPPDGPPTDEALSVALTGTLLLPVFATVPAGLPIAWRRLRDRRRR